MVEQIKIGNFLKELRKEKGITQEKLAEELNVSGRTVSRWERGNNMPDISILVEIAKFYDVSIVEIINAQRQKEFINDNEKDIANTISEYSIIEKEEIFKKIKFQSLFGSFALLLYLFFNEIGAYIHNNILMNLRNFCQTIVFLSILVIAGYATGSLKNLYSKNKISYAFKNISEILRLVIIMAAFCTIVVLLKMILAYFF